VKSLWSNEAVQSLEAGLRARTMVRDVKQVA
jgi:hypothetical protein